MEPNVCIAISGKTLRAMLDYQEAQECEFDPASLAELAIYHWHRRQRELAKPQGKRTRSRTRNKANRIASPKPAEPALAAAPMEAPPRSLPDGPLLTPRLRPDAEERRHSYRRAEDLLLD